MDKHRQSAVADFMQSLEQLDELWGNAEAETESVFFDNGLKGAEADETAHCSSPQHLNAEHLNSKAPKPEANAQQP